MGGVVNAGVLRDFTRFYLTVPGRNLELAVDALSALVLMRDFPAEALPRECAIIEEESRGRLDRPRAILNDLAFEEIYGPDHPYSHPTDGYPYTLRTIGPGGLSLFHQTWYVPNNIAVIVTGNVEFEEVRAAVDSAFGRLTPAPLPARAWPSPPRPPPARDIAVETSLDQTRPT